MITPVPHLPAALHGQRLVVVDIEGNGQQPPEIIEFAGLPVDDERRGTEEGMRSWLIRPRTHIHPMVTRKVHGISDADVADCPAWVDVSGEIAALLDGRVLIAHNASVELRVISTHLPDWRPPMVIDTLKLAKHVWLDLPGYGLDKLVAHTGIDPVRFGESGYHRAAYDAWCAWQLLLRLVDDGELDWSGLVEAAALPGFTQVKEPEGGLW